MKHFFDGQKFRQYDPNGEKVGIGKQFGSARLTISNLNEKPNDEWNLVELYVVGSNAVHLVNSMVVNLIEDAHIFIFDARKALNVGKIQHQSEGATIYSKEVMIKSISEFPQEIKTNIK